MATMNELNPPAFARGQKDRSGDIGDSIRAPGEGKVGLGRSDITRGKKTRKKKNHSNMEDIFTIIIDEYNNYKCNYEQLL